MTKQSRMVVGALLLAIACALAWWAYREMQKRELQQQALALVQDSTARLREALGLLEAGPEAREKLQAHFAALEDNVEKAHALNASIHPAVVHAARGYITDVHALLRRQIALHAGRDAVHAGIGEIDKHLRNAGMRSPDWIPQALALKQRLERSFFDYRLAAGGLEKSLRSLADTRRMEAFLPAAAAIEQDRIAAAEKRLLALSTQLEHQVENARRLPGG